MLSDFTREYSKRLGVLTGEQLQRVLDQFDLGNILSAEPITAGLFGQNLFLASTRGQYVLRGKPHGPEQFPKELFFARLLHERTGSPVPWPYLRDESTDIFGWEYVLMPRMPGLATGLKEVRSGLSAQDRRAIAGAMGRTLAELHALTWPHHGEYRWPADTIEPLTMPFDERVCGHARESVQWACQANDRTTGADVTWVNDVLDAAGPALRVPFTPTYVHHDFKEGNAVADRVEGQWRVTGVFDLQEGYFGDPEEDLPRCLAEYIDEDIELAREFVRAYAAARPFRPGFQERSRVYMLADRLVIWSYGQHHGWFRPTTKMRDYIQPFLAAGLP